MKKWVNILFSVGIIFGLLYYFLVFQVSNAFTSDASREMVESAASSLLYTEQIYGFRLVNESNKKLKLLGIQLVDYQGISISNLTIDGHPFTASWIPSHRVNSGINSWSTNSQGVEVEYLAEIKEPTIRNPENALIAYSYLGIKHQQKVKIPGLRQH